MRSPTDLIVIVGLLLPAAAFAAPAASRTPVVPTFELRTDEIMNLVYQLDCLPQGKDCAFDTLWKQELGWTAKDDAALARRQQIKERYDWRVTFDDKLDDGPLMFDTPRALELRKKLVLAASGAKDIRSYRARLEMVVTATDAGELAAITESFLPRFRRFFAGVRPALSKVKRELGPYFANPGVTRVVGEAMAFYEVPRAQPHRLEVQLIALPPNWTGHTSGEQVEHLSLVETSPKQPAEKRRGNLSATASIALHELFHYFYGAVPGEQTRALGAAFAASEDQGSAAAYALLNEVLATALSAVARKASVSAAEWRIELAGPGHWYNDVPIDTVAKAIWPWIEERLARGSSLYEAGFVPGYVRLVRAAMGRALDRPALRLRTLIAVVEDEHVRGRLPGVPAGRTQIARPIEELETLEGLVKHREQSAVIKVRGKSLARLRFWEPVLGKGTVERLADLRAKHGSFVQAVKRGAYAAIFVIVAEAPEDFEKLDARLVAAEEPFEVLTLRP
jgi:hypothetical protein